MNDDKKTTAVSAAIIAGVAAISTGSTHNAIAAESTSLTQESATYTQEVVDRASKMRELATAARADEGLQSLLLLDPNAAAARFGLQFTKEEAVALSASDTTNEALELLEGSAGPALRSFESSVLFYDTELGAKPPIRGW